MTHNRLSHDRVRGLGAGKLYREQIGPISMCANGVAPSVANLLEIQENIDFLAGSDGVFLENGCPPGIQAILASLQLGSLSS